MSAEKRKIKNNMHYFIVNPNARSHQGIVIWKGIKQVLDEREIDYREILTNRPGDATKAARRLTQNSDRKVNIVVLGGDGTLNETINGIEHISNVTLGYIPIGSSNDFARAMNISDTPIEILEEILNPKAYMKLDYGIVSSGDYSRKYVVSAGIGYDAGVCYETNYSSIKKILNKLHLGKATYIVIAIKQLLTQKFVDGYISIDEENDIKLHRLVLAATHIQKYEGGGLMFCPKADPTDGILDICIAMNIARLGVIGIIPKAYKGKHIKYRGIDNYTCKKVTIKTEMPLYVHTDGESFVAGEKFLHNQVTFENSDDQIRYIMAGIHN